MLIFLSAYLTYEDGRPEASPGKLISLRTSSAMLTDIRKSGDIGPLLDPSKLVCKLVGS